MKYFLVVDDLLLRDQGKIIPEAQFTEIAREKLKKLKIGEQVKIGHCTYRRVRAPKRRR